MGPDEYEIMIEEEGGKSFVNVYDAVTRRVLLKFRNDEKKLRRMDLDYENYLEQMIYDFMECKIVDEDSNYDYDITVVYESKVPYKIRNIAFCRFHHLGQKESAQLCGIAPSTFRKNRKKDEYFIQYFRFYLRHSSGTDRILRSELRKRSTKYQKKYTLFRAVLYNPFVTAKELAMKYDIGDASTVRHHLKDCYDALLRGIKRYEGGNYFLWWFLVPFEICLHDRLQRPSRPKKTPRREIRIP